MVKVPGLAWLESGKPDLDRAERFGTDFGGRGRGQADRAAARMASSIASVRRPVAVFCWLGW